VCMVCPWVFFHSCSFPTTFLYSMLIHAFNMSKSCQFTLLSLILYFLHLKLSANACVSDYNSPGFTTIALRNFISTACSLLSSVLVHVHVSAPYHCLFYKYKLNIVILHFLSISLFHNKLYNKILKPFQFFHLQ
jgi:succinate dehydrogenase hydrophobic anchor subunit